jgi:hypothetical protein
MWSIEYPYDKFPEKIANMTFTRNQKLNHFPGIPFLINKRSLSINTKSKYILPGFHIPKDREKFTKFAAENSEKKFVMKNFDNRGVKIVPESKIKKMNFGNRQ